MIAATPPAIQLELRQAPVIRGSGFQSGEPITIRLTRGRLVRVQHTRTDENGRFRLRVSLLFPLDVCDGTVVATATGESGDRARLERSCLPPDRATP